MCDVGGVRGGGGFGGFGDLCIPVIPRPGIGRRGAQRQRRRKSDRFTEPCQQGGCYMVSCDAITSLNAGFG